MRKYKCIKPFIIDNFCYLDHKQYYISENTIWKLKELDSKNQKCLLEIEYGIAKCIQKENERVCSIQTSFKRLIENFEEITSTENILNEVIVEFEKWLSDKNKDDFNKGVNTCIYTTKEVFNKY